VRATVRFRLPDGQAVELGHGDLIGRLWSAALAIPDGRISEAHALVSLRGQELKLLALRGRFALDERPLQSLVLEAGQRITFAEGLVLEVEEVMLPPAVLGLEGDGLPRQVLGAVCSLVTRPRPELVPRYLPQAAARIWSDGEDWRIDSGGREQLLSPGISIEVDGRSFRAVAMPLESAGLTATRLDGAVHRRLRVVAQFDTAQIYREGGTALALSGLSARIISEVVAFDGPVPWRVLAQELWSDEDHPHLLRRKLDVNLSRLRSKLRDAGIRPDLVRSDGLGHIELFLHEGDKVEDRT
jgi:hypothetical protein